MTEDILALTQLCCSEPFDRPDIHLDSICSLVEELCSGANKICTVIVLPHGGSQGRMPYSVKCSSEINEEMVQFCWFWK